VENLKADRAAGHLGPQIEEDREPPFSPKKMQRQSKKRVSRMGVDVSSNARNDSLLQDLVAMTTRRCGKIWIEREKYAKGLR